MGGDGGDIKWWKGWAVYDASVWESKAGPAWPAEPVALHVVGMYTYMSTLMYTYYITCIYTCISAQSGQTDPFLQMLLHYLSTCLAYVCARQLIPLLNLALVLPPPSFNLLLF